MKLRSLFIVSLLISTFSAHLHAQKTLKLVHDGTYWGQVVVTYTERGQFKKYDSGRGIDNKYEHTIYLSDDVKNIKATVYSNRGFGAYGQGCSKSLGSSGGTFTFGGPIYSETCHWAPDEVAASGGAVTSIVNINEILPGGNTHLHNAVKAGETSEVKSLLNNGIIHMETVNNKGFTPLMEAAAVKNYDMVDLLINNGASVYAVDKRGQSLLYMAVNKGDHQLAGKIIDAGYDVNSAEKEVERAIQRKDEDMVRLFLHNNMSANQVADIALQKNNIDVIHVALEEYGANPSVDLYKKAVDSRKFDLAQMLIEKDIDPEQAIDYAILKKNDQLITSSLEKGADANKALKYGITNKKALLVSDAINMYSADANQYLREAINTKNAEIISAILDSGSDKSQALTHVIALNNRNLLDLVLGYSPDIKDSHLTTLAQAGKDQELEAVLMVGGNPDTALKAAMSAGKYKTAEMLLTNHEVSTENIVKTAVEKKQKPLLQAAIGKGADPNPGLETAINMGMTDYASLLFEAGASTSNSNVILGTIGQQNEKMLQLLIDNQTDVSDEAFIKKAAELKNKKMIAMLVDNGADPNFAMPVAINANDADLVKLLIDNQADASQPEFMSTAASKKNGTIVNLLLENGADPNEGMLAAVKVNAGDIVKNLLEANADGSDDTLIKASVAHNNPALTSMLIQAGADPNAALSPTISANAAAVLQLLINEGVDTSDDRYLVEAVNGNKTTIVPVLINNGSDAQYIDAAGNSYLHVAAKQKYTELIPVLANAGVDPNTANAAGDTALHLAVQTGRKSSTVIEQLLAIGADVNAPNGSGKTCLDIAKGMKVKKTLKKAGGKKTK